MAFMFWQTKLGSARSQLPHEQCTSLNCKPTAVVDSCDPRKLLVLAKNLLQS